MKTTRADKMRGQRSQFQSAKKRILATESVCGICGREVDKTLEYPHPMSATIDHIIPLDKGGHPSDIDNLQLAHFCCNRQKSNKLVKVRFFEHSPEVISNRLLPLSADWKTV